jgi:hypothetical protein
MKKNNRWFAVALLAAVLTSIPAPAGSGQGKEVLRPVFPAALLDGDPHFDLAIHLQGDIRGNFGPCG